VNPVVELKDIHKTYYLGDTGVHALRGITLSIMDGEFLCIMGPSGSGKSTLISIIGCLTTADSGRYLLQGRDITQIPTSLLPAIRNKVFGFIFQQFHLLPRLSALRNVELPLIYSGCRYRDRYKLIYETLSRVGLKERMLHLPNQLSGGEQQRVAIARALVNNPKIIVADEPTGNLDSNTGKEIMDVFKEMNKKGKTIVLVTHDERWREYASRIITLKDGRING
jgi:putative ABC transport system ATP-binding protein